MNFGPSEMGSNPGPLGFSQGGNGYLAANNYDFTCKLKLGKWEVPHEVLCGLLVERNSSCMSLLSHPLTSL